MAIERHPHLTIPVKTYSHYSECEPWLLECVGEWNLAWWRDFPDMIMNITLGEVPQPETYWFYDEKHALAFRLKFK